VQIKARFRRGMERLMKDGATLRNVSGDGINATRDGKTGPKQQHIQKGT